MIDVDRLAQIKTLGRGFHKDLEAGCCAMEAVAYIAREPWSDRPECVCPVIGAFMRAWNDGLRDEDRTRLILPLLPHLVGTRSATAVENRRALMATDWLVRVFTPAWLRLAKLEARADALETLPEITSVTQAPSIYGPIRAAGRDATAAWQGEWVADWVAARAAAMDAGRDAADNAAYLAARDAAKAVAWGDATKVVVWFSVRDGPKAAAMAAGWVAARDAAEAAWDAAEAAARKTRWHAAWVTRFAAFVVAGGAAGDAAGAAKAAALGAARDAARNAATDAMKPTVERLQQAALDLVSRMIEIR